MRRLLLTLFTAIGILVLLSASARAGGISVDAGLTPSEDRWILRTQFRYMQRNDDPTQMGMEMSTYAFPIVLAYGLRPDLTLMLRQAVMHQKMFMTGNTTKNSGLGDLFFLAKYKAYRLNTPKYTIGISPTIGLEFPTGGASFTSETWDPKTGLYISARIGPWAMDFNIAFTWNGLADRGKNDKDPGDELSLDLAFAYQFSIGEKAQVALAPVLELSYKNIWPDRLKGQDMADTGEFALYLSPGIKFSMSWVILEALVQFPVWQEQEGAQLERDVAILAGTRFLF